MPLSPDELELAEDCYGYGRWEGDYWFIGFEEGQAPNEHNDFIKRAEAFRKLNKDGLCDCREFHKMIGETRFHREWPALQSTWRPLMLLLMTYLEEPKRGNLTDDDYKVLREYQRCKWGSRSSEGETCLIELSGLPASNTKISAGRPKEIQEQLERIRPGRLEHIHAKMIELKPTFVVIYTIRQMSYWKDFWKDKSEVVSRSERVFQLGSTTIVFAPAPVRSPGNRYWVDLANTLREERGTSVTTQHHN
jgi:hypothetical protein